MATKTKIKILDDKNMRNEIDFLYEKIDQVILAKWSLEIAKHILEIAEIEYLKIDEIVDGFKINELWQQGKARIYDVRKAGFSIHKLTRDSDNEIYTVALRVVGHAVASAHMKEHSMVASDYAVKVINLLYPNDMNRVLIERNWQLNKLKDLIWK